MSYALKLGEESQSSATQPKRNTRVLVVEDEREIAKVYQDILSSPKGSNARVRNIRSSRRAAEPTVMAGDAFEVSVAHTGEQALALVKESLEKGNPFAMGFFDVLLGPGLDGISLAQEVLKLDPRMNFVFVTAYQDRSVDAIRALLGESSECRWDYLNKPFSTGEILQKARNFVSLWNLELERDQRDHQLNDLRKRLLQHERTSSVAAVSRGVTHEFGNILMQIMGKADMGLRKKPEEMKESLEKILEASHRANKILERFKNLAEGKPVEQRKSQVFIDQLLKEAIGLMEHTLTQSRIKVCQIKRDKVMAMVDETGLMQVLVNLMINSIHAMPNSGQIDFSITDLGQDFEIRMRDYGPGVPSEILPHILEPFYTTKGQEGTGLGLAISREIIEVEHQGEFIAQNHPAKGFEVQIRIPKVSAQTEEAI